MNRLELLSSSIYYLHDTYHVPSLDMHLSNFGVPSLDAAQLIDEKAPAIARRSDFSWFIRRLILFLV